MGEASTKRGYLYGILLATGLLIIGYAANSVIGHLAISRLLWPGNLYLVLILIGLGIAVGLVSNSEIVNRISSLEYQIPSIVILILLGGVSFLQPEGFSDGFLQVVYRTPVILLSGFIYFSVGLSLLKRVKQLKKSWPILGVLSASMLFVFVSVLGVHDYYMLDMKVGPDRAIFTAQNEDGRFLRVPFAIKVLNDSILLGAQSDSLNKVNVRVFNTVSDFEDVTITSIESYKIKGWKIGLDEQELIQAKTSGLVDLKLEFDRWLELRYVSVFLLMISLFLKIKY